MKNSGSKPIAQRYVKALFNAASEQRAVEAIEKDMASLAASIAASPELRMLITSPLVSKENQQTAMDLLLKKMGTHPLTAQFVALLAEKKRLGILEDATAIFADMAASARGEIKAEMICAAAPSKEAVAQASETLGKLTGKTVRLRVKVDPSLLGGAVIKIGSQQLDGSLAGKLERLEQKLKAA